MPAKPATIPATITLDPAALAGLTSTPAEIAPLLERVARLLDEVLEHLHEPILVDAAGAERLTGLSEKTLRNHTAPHVKIGSSRRYRPEALRKWAAERERQESLVTK